MKNLIVTLLSVLLSISIETNARQIEREKIDLTGYWHFQSDIQNQGIELQYWNKTLPEQVLLPGTTDTNRKGKLNTHSKETSNLSRFYTYQGPAWYSREIEIPNNWAEKHIVLFMERTRPTMVWIDEEEIGSNNYLSSPHRYDLTNKLTPGKHKITIRVDNGESIPSQIRSNSHACTESTQTNWNGIIGRIELQATNLLHIEDVQVYPMVTERAVKVKIRLSDAIDKQKHKLILSAEAFNSTQKHKVPNIELELTKGVREYEWIYPLGKKAMLWSDLSPTLYRLRICIEGIDEKEVTFGLRDFKAAGTHFTINGTTTFLRGKHDACVFPLTGHTAMNVEEWRSYFKTCKEYGINHCRFHSWCPPEACFEAADLEGIYLQPELTIWGSFDKNYKELMNFLFEDGKQIQQEYSNHPSFVLFTLGNELSGDLNVMKEFLTNFRKMENRHLYAFGSNIFLGSKGYLPDEDFLVTCRIGYGEGYTTHSRASFSFADADEGGYLNNTYPNTEMNFDNALKKAKIPVIGHETGQFQTYPNYEEIKKYKGVLFPRNFEIFKQRLEKAGMADQANDFFRASGAWSVALYRADIEMNLRSERIAGFQLLDLQDYPGQGSAYVGILDAFMESKGLVTPEKWRESCSEVVPLFIMKKYCWKGGEPFTGKIKVANYGTSNMKGKKITWTLRNSSSIIGKGETTLPEGSGLLTIGEISLSLPNIEHACKAELSLEIKGTAYRNSYPIWIYPNSKHLNTNGILITRQFDETTLKTLQQGGKVLWMPQRSDCQHVTVGGLFQTDYWNYRMFKSICDNINKPASPGTLGILTNPTHKLFDDFPTEYHTNWQWYPIIKHSYPLIIDQLPSSYRPIVQVIDNIERNHKLGLIMEFNVENGKLLLCMADLEEAKHTPEGLQLYAGILDYMHTSDFRPQLSLSAKALQTLFTEQNNNVKIEVLNNISYE